MEVKKNVDGGKNDFDDVSSFKLKTMLVVNDKIESEKEENTCNNTKIKELIQSSKNKNEEDVENYRKIAYEYYLKSEDLEEKCSILHKNLVDVKEAWDKVKKQRDEAVNERENMTLKYAHGERKFLAEIQLREKTEVKCRKIIDEKKLIEHKLQIAIEEKNKMCTMYDKKIIEYKKIRTEIERIENDNCILKNELKLCENALKQQAELYGESLRRIEELNEKLSKSCEKIETIEKEAEERIEIFKISEENRALALSKIVEDQQTKMILVKHENENQQKEIKNLHFNLDILQAKNKELCEENRHLFFKMQQLEKEKAQAEEQVDELKTERKKQENFLEEMREKSTKFDQIELEMIEQKRKTEILRENKQTLEEKYEEISNELESLRIKEKELLKFTEQSIDNNINLQMETKRLNSIVERNEKYKNENLLLTKQLNEINENFLLENNRSKEGVDKMKRTLSKEKLMNFHLKQRLMEHKNEIQIMKRKYNISIREMRRELSSNRSNTTCLSGTSPSTDCGCQNALEMCQNDIVQVIQPIGEVNSNILIERLVKLQKISAKKSEKIDFLEDRVNGLLFDLRNKSSLLQIYLLKEQTGVLTPNEMDENKMVFAKIGGIMGSIFANKINDTRLTLELSLEINRRLQAVLEDSLLKNIILKKNIDTLGQEIDCLKKLQEI